MLPIFCLQFLKLDEIVHYMKTRFDENPFRWKPVSMKTHSTLWSSNIAHFLHDGDSFDRMDEIEWYQDFLNLIPI